VEEVVNPSGDFNDDGRFVFVPTLDVGVNIVTGDTADDPPLPDDDYFGALMLPNHVITDISIAVSNYVGGTGTASELDVSPNNVFPPLNGRVEFRGDGVFQIPGGLDYNPNEDFQGLAIKILSGESGLSRDTFSYVVSITVAFVPEPGTGLLVMAGLLGLAARRRCAWR
jgi:hypothetical protein